MRTIRLVQQISWVFVTQEREKKRKHTFFLRIRDHPRLFYPAPCPWIPCSEIVHVEGEKIGIPKIPLHMNKGSPPLSQRAGTCRPPTAHHSYAFLNSRED